MFVNFSFRAIWPRPASESLVTSLANLTPHSSAEKGMDLERRIAQYFVEHGYVVTTNQTLTGRSGGRHEIDVLAQRNDGVTTFRVAIECKAWQQPIDKEVVAKVAYVSGDVGINKAIIVSLHGWQIGAELAATQQGVELWGPSELEQRLGRVTASGALAGPFRRSASGFRIAVGRPIAEGLIKGERWGLFWHEAETIDRVEQLWIPVWVLGLACSRVERNKLRTTPQWNVYEAITGTLVTQLAGEPQLAEIDVGRSRLVHQVTSKMIARRLATAIQKIRSVVTESARNRYARQLRSMGVPPDVREASIDRALEGYFPVFAGFLSHKGTQRVMVVDAVWGKLWPNLGSVLTANVGYIAEAIKD
jgi:Holliday junction resolvase